MTKDTLIAYIEKFKDANVLVVGDAMLDHYVFGKVERLNPEAPVPVLHAQKEADATGGAGNVAKNLATLSAKATLIGVVGHDETAKRLEEVTKREGYDFQGVVDSDRPTIRKTRFMVQSQQLLRVDYEETKDVSKSVEKKIISHLEAAAGAVDAILISDYAKGTITETVAKAVLSAGKKHGVLVASDIKPSRAKFVVGSSFISPNLKEGYEILGVNPLEHGQMEPGEVAEKLHAKMKTDVYLTLGAGGVYVKTSSVTEHVPQEHVAQVFDVSGAGDTFIVAVMLALLSGASPREAALLGNAAGAVVVGKVGSVGISKEELVAMIEHRHS